LLCSSLLLVFDPADDLVPVEDQSAVGLEAEVRKPPRNEGLPYGPRRTADDTCRVADCEWQAEARAGGHRAGSETRRDWPWFATICPRLRRIGPNPAISPASARKARNTRMAGSHARECGFASQRVSGLLRLPSPGQLVGQLRGQPPGQAGRGVGRGKGPKRPVIRAFSDAGVWHDCQWVCRSFFFRRHMDRNRSRMKCGTWIYANQRMLNTRISMRSCNWTC